MNPNLMAAQYNIAPDLYVISTGQYTNLYTHVIITGPADGAALALDALPAVLARRRDRVRCELRAGWVTWGCRSQV